MTNKELLLWLDRIIRERVNFENGTVEYATIRSVVDHLLYEIDNEPKPITKFIFVEDGSVDTDELEERLAQTNPEIKVVVYRQGAHPPEFVEVK